jgi:hypothetical protein
MVAVRAERLLDEPIITEATHPSIGRNIQGPSLIRLPDWVDGQLGRYYLYFADHKGSYIRLAYADDLLGPWTVHPPGSLQLDQSRFPTEHLDFTPEQVEAAIARIKATGINLDGLGHDLAKEMTWPHIASPDVHIDHGNRRIVMYFHGLESFGRQLTRVATSRDGISFEAGPEILGKNYWRAFNHGGYTYALAMPGQLYRSRDPLSGFEAGPLIFNPDMRHCALLKKDDVLHVFWTQVGDTPERILLSIIDLSGDWDGWKESEAIEILRPEMDYEGADAPLEPSVRSIAYGHVNQLRDPAIYVEDGDVYLLYAVAGESGIAIAKLHVSH